ncbi:Helix-turn-helix transcriptional regulator OS=Streptomyces microflavus OX=1919 GN=HUT09_15840 PE=4 SV=1 [Streptomyces microflavus]
MPAQNLQVRTTELTVERLIIIDRSWPTSPPRPDRNTALAHHATPLWSVPDPRLRRPLGPGHPASREPRGRPPRTPLTAVQHSIARLLAEGHVDEVVARKMGISVRTCRSHIAKLMQTLGATSRTHLGTLLARSGITSPHEPPT